MEKKDNTITYHYIVKGRVQGVAFRYYTLQAAHRFGVRGTVKNLFNGDVEVYAQGDAPNISLFENFLNTGPPSAHVTGLLKNQEPGHTTYNDFQLIY